MTRKKNDDGAAPDKRRARGDGGLYWDEDRQRWRGEITVGYRPDGRRITRKTSDPDKTKALKKLKELQREIDDGLPVASGTYTVADSVRDFLKHGLHGRSQSTVEKLTNLADEHVFPYFKARTVRELTADDVDDWLLAKSTTLATRTLGDLRSLLRRALTRAQRRGKVGRNVVLLCDDLPKGLEGRPSKALTFDQALAVLKAAEGSRLHAYIVLSLLIGARTEELRPLTWADVDLTGDPDKEPPVPPHIYVLRSVREGGDTKTRKSRRGLALPQRCVDALIAQQARIEKTRATAGARWQPNDLVFPTWNGTQMDAGNVRRGFRTVLRHGGFTAEEAEQWTPRELRHSFVSLLSDNDMPVEQISKLVGHQTSLVTEKVYRHQIRPVLQHGARAMDQIFPTETEG